jgi:uncharacterized protein YjiS (DUF1127 family)
MRLDNLNIGDIGVRYQPVRSVENRLSRAAAVITSWRRRARERAEFASWGPALKRDIGITDADIWRETRKWFWQD